ncbi:hypothetical protein P168DRAFT_190543 [Aspergillus campestris IBT 28561]|uniref:Uncharacterized protein n=1 Tax=Aspergillus campestris (strain IBT 28561) TaxID=1392248 RepID=A0A2I1CYM3_ASPC2|nr:uncharacterized protein P168DRAFT_190543 [Aspergillus campestris IBT 28561]PKY02722.1 hypothetical protein P168DRAFT_190543 [Aspergillus campestris IBT 28561]
MAHGHMARPCLVPFCPGPGPSLRLGPLRRQCMAWPGLAWQGWMDGRKEEVGNQLLTHPFVHDNDDDDDDGWAEPCFFLFLLSVWANANWKKTTSLINYLSFVLWLFFIIHGTFCVFDLFRFAFSFFVWAFVLIFFFFSFCYLKQRHV